MVIGTVIGSGIFLVPTEMVRAVGSPDAVFFVWIFAGLLSLAGALTYAELGAALPEAGGEYAYLREAYGPFWGFLYSWTMTLVGKSGSVATLATAFYLYLANFVPQLDAVVFTVDAPIGPNGEPLQVVRGQFVAILTIVGFCVINFFGVKLGGQIQIAITAAKVILILGIVVLGLTWEGGSTANLASSADAPGGIAGFFVALVAALWAYDGWNNSVMVASEIQRPQRNLPRALILGVIVVMAVYMLTNLAYFYVLPAAAVGSSERVAATMMEQVLGKAGAGAVSVAAIISILGALNGSLLAGSRIPYAAARDGLFFRKLAYVHPTHRTPAASILALGFLAALLVCSGRYRELFTYVIFSQWILYTMAAAAVIVLRRKRPELVRPYRTLGYPVVPVLFCLVAIGLLVSTLLSSPRESLLGLVLIVAGVPFYRYWRRRTLL